MDVEEKTTYEDRDDWRDVVKCSPADRGKSTRKMVRKIRHSKRICPERKHLNENKYLSLSKTCTVWFYLGLVGFNIFLACFSTPTSILYVKNDLTQNFDLENNLNFGAMI